MAKKTKKEKQTRKMSVVPVEKEVEYAGTTVLAKLFEATNPIDGSTEVFSTRKEAAAWVKEKRQTKKGKRVFSMISKFHDKLTDEKLTAKFEEVADEETWDKFCDLTTAMADFCGIEDEE